MIEPKITDLTESYKSAVRGFAQEVATTYEKDGWNSTKLQFNSHSGTHMDAPLHFDVNSTTIDQIPVAEFVGRAWVLDLRHIGSKGLIEVGEIQKAQHMDFKPGDSLIFWTDWSKHADKPQFWDDLPRVGESMAKWCVQNQVKMLAVEPPSVADVNNMEEITRIHQILLEKVIIIEGIANLDSLKASCVELIALPLKIKDCDGAPARVIAIEKY